MGLVNDIKLGKTDQADRTIACIYAIKEQTYAVYGTQNRVVVQYADKLEDQAPQRANLVALTPLRAEIDGLIDGWRNDGDPKHRQKSGHFDRRVADAIVVALEGDSANAQTILQHVKEDIDGEKRSLGQLQYLLSAALTAVACFLALQMIKSEAFRASFHRFPGTTDELWLAGRAGIVGAIFSIAIGIRSKDIRPNLNYRDNVTDALLRILVGVIGAGAVVAMLRSGALPTITIGGASIDAVNGFGTFWGVVAVGFFAGFSERLVPELLAKVTNSQKPVTPNARAAPPLDPAGGVAKGAGAPGPDGGGGGTADDGSGPGPDGAPDEHPEDHVDGCACDLPHDPQEVTSDEALPVAQGGVAPAPAP